MLSNFLFPATEPCYKRVIDVYLIYFIQKMWVSLLRVKKRMWKTMCNLVDLDGCEFKSYERDWHILYSIIVSYCGDALQQ